MVRSGINPATKLSKAVDGYRRHRAIKAWMWLKLLIIDEVSYPGLDGLQASSLSQVIRQRYQKVQSLV
jgi:DNA replication protein DnaC